MTRLQAARGGRPSARRRVLPLVAAPLAVLAGLLGLAWSSGSRAGPAPPCSSQAPRGLPGGAVELTAGDRVWAAWLSYPPAAGEVITVLWRAEGFVPPELGLAGRDLSGNPLAVEFGPSPVLPQLRGGGLQWPRPGREWGSRLLFTHPGCWRVVVDAGEAKGALTLWVRR